MAQRAWEGAAEAVGGVRLDGTAEMLKGSL